MKKAIVTGGTGFLGRHLIENLIERGYLVYAVVRPNSKNLSSLPCHEQVYPIFCELNDMENHMSLLPEHCDVFFHFAWGGVNREQIDNDVVHETNIEYSLGCVRTAIKLGCKAFVDAGSRVEYGRVDGYFKEDLPCNPLVAYGRAKIKFSEKAKLLCKNTATKFLHARIYSVYGIDDHPWSLIYTCVAKMLRNEPIELSECLHKWNFMAVEDTADLLVTLFEQMHKIPKDDNCIFNVATDDIRPLRQFVESIKKQSESCSELRFGAFKQGSESAMSIMPDMSKVTTIFGWKPKVTFEEGIQKMIAVMEANV